MQEHGLSVWGSEQDPSNSATSSIPLAYHHPSLKGNQPPISRPAEILLLWLSQQRKGSIATHNLSQPNSPSTDDFPRGAALAQDHTAESLPAQRLDFLQPDLASFP